MKLWRIEIWRTHWAPWIIIVGFVLFFLIGSQYRQSRENCRKIDKLDAALIKIVSASTLRAPKPGEYGYAYYVSHPREARALRGGQVNAKQLRILRSAACDPANIGP